jgi:hypothetical protein
MGKINMQRLVIIVVSSITIILILFFGTIIWFTNDGTIKIGSNLVKADWLSFWGGFLGFVGTCLLGGLSIWQNYRLDAVNRRITEQNSISTFYSLLIPETIIFNKQYISKSILEVYDTSSFQSMHNISMLVDDSLELDSISCQLILKNQTNYLPIRFLVRRFCMYKIIDEKKQVFIERISSTDQEFISFSFDSETKNEILNLNLHLSDIEKIDYEKNNSNTSFWLTLDFSYINPFNIKVDCIISTCFLFETSNHNYDQFNKDSIFIESMNCSYIN